MVVSMVPWPNLGFRASGQHPPRPAIAREGHRWGASVFVQSLNRDGSMPSFRIRARSVWGLMSSTAAAPR